jgi:hypothetical protein
MTVVLSLIGAAIILTITYQMWLIDCLVRWEYEHHREQWERDGKPDGYFWCAKECKFWSSDMAKKRLPGAWLFRTPDWAAKSPECRRWLIHLRIIASLVSLTVVAILLRIFFRL